MLFSARAKTNLVLARALEIAMVEVVVAAHPHHLDLTRDHVANPRVAKSAVLKPSKLPFWLASWKPYEHAKSLAAGVATRANAS